MKAQYPLAPDRPARQNAGMAARGLPMAFRKTGSRRIVVDGIAYRWRFNHRVSSGAWDGCMGCVVTVQKADCNGSVLTIRYEEHHPTVAAVWGGPIISVRPAHVASAIRTAITDGWRPADKGAGFSVRGERDSVANKPPT
jgi:hypothetical protein